MHTTANKRNILVCVCDIGEKQKKTNENGAHVCDGQYKQMVTFLEFTESLWKSKFIFRREKDRQRERARLKRNQRSNSLSRTVHTYIRGRNFFHETLISSSHEKNLYLWVLVFYFFILLLLLVVFFNLDFFLSSLYILRKIVRRENEEKE